MRRPSLRRLSLSTSAALGVVLACAATPTSAFAQAYVGKWASDPAQCRVDQSQENAPLIVKKRGFDQHETHCAFTSIRGRSPTWQAKARCDVQGDKQDLAITLTVKGNRLDLRYGDGGSPSYQRCR